MSLSRRPWVAISVMLVTLLNSTWSQAPSLSFGTQAPSLFRRARFAGQHGRALLAFKAESGMIESKWGAAFYGTSETDKSVNQLMPTTSTLLLNK